MPAQDLCKAGREERAFTLSKLEQKNFLRRMTDFGANLQGTRNFLFKSLERLQKLVESSETLFALEDFMLGKFVSAKPCAEPESPGAENLNRNYIRMPMPKMGAKIAKRELGPRKMEKTNQRPKILPGTASAGRKKKIKAKKPLKSHLGYQNGSLERLLAAPLQASLDVPCSKCGQNTGACIGPAPMYSLFLNRNRHQFPIFNFNFELKGALLNRLSAAVATALEKLAAKSPTDKREPEMDGLGSAVMKFMSSQEISSEELLQLSLRENAIFSLFLRKKGFLLGEAGSTAPVLQTRNLKRVEENLKLVFNKAMGFLKRVFQNTFGDTLERHLCGEYRGACNASEYCFFGFYFEEAALRLDQEIERFFVPKILSKRRSPGFPGRRRLVPKTISKVYLSRIRMGHAFMEHFRLFLAQGFCLERTEKICAKTQALLAKWGTLVRHFGPKKGFSMVEDRIRGSERNKLAWTVKDVQIAREQTLRYLAGD